MTALIQERMRSFERWTYHHFILAAGKKVFRHGMVGLNAATGKVEPAAAASTLFVIGVADQTVDATAGDARLNVNLCREIEVEWWVNDTTISAVNVGAIAYALDDNTVTLTANTCMAGRIWAVDPARGVAVEKLPGRPLASAPAADEGGEAPLFVGGNTNLPDDPPNDSLITLPPTSANSTVTLPDNAAPGTRLLIVADGVANAHTVQYRDPDGPTNLTAPLAAHRRHVVLAVFVGGKWFVNAYMSP